MASNGGLRVETEMPLSGYDGNSRRSRNNNKVATDELLDCNPPVTPDDDSHVVVNQDGRNVRSYAMNSKAFFTEQASQPMLNDISGILRILQFIGLYPADVTTNGRSFHSTVHTVKVGVFCLITLIGVAINGLVLVFNAILTKHTRDQYGILHAKTISIIITGIVPLHNFLNILTFALSTRCHKRVLSHMDLIETNFRVKFGRTPPLSRYKTATYCCVFVSAFLPFCIRVVEYFVSGFDLMWINKVSFLLIPFLRLWQLVPLIYFEFLSAIIRYWYNALNKIVRNDYNNSARPMIYYYKLFLQLTVLTRRFGDWQNLFIMESLGINVIVLCLTIYFITQNDNAKDAYNIGKDSNVEKLVFILLWSLLQVVIAAIYIFVLCNSGRKTNEAARKILHSALSSHPATEDDKFQVIRFVQKINSQYAWGIAVWRAFPIERGLLFTIVSSILAYSIILNRLKASECIFIGANGTTLTPPIT